MPVFRFLGRVFSVLWKTWFLLWFVFTMVLFYPFFRILLSREDWFSMAFRLKKIWAHVLLFGAGIIYRVSYELQLPNKPFVFCPNHTSYLDIIISYCILPHYFVFMGKQELSKVPLFRIFFVRMNILVNRKSAKDAHRAFVRAGAELQKGHSVVLFPEGTISREVPHLRPFKNGAFRLAIEQQVPLVPITFFNHYRLLRDAPYLQGTCRPGRARIHVHAPIDTAGMGLEQMESLKERVRNIIADSLTHYPNIQPNLSV